MNMVATMNILAVVAVSCTVSVGGFGRFLPLLLCFVLFRVDGFGTSGLLCSVHIQARPFLVSGPSFHLGAKTGWNIKSLAIEPVRDLKRRPYSTSTSSSTTPPYITGTLGGDLFEQNNPSK